MGLPVDDDDADGEDDDRVALVEKHALRPACDVVMDGDATTTMLRQCLDRCSTDTRDDVDAMDDIDATGTCLHARN